MKNIAIIPARGGSKRIHKKNIRLFLDKPIIAYSIEIALESGLFDEVMVSTEDEKIAKISRQYGANIPFMRSLKNADDFASTTSVLLEVIQNYENQSIFFENACCLYPTAPFITSQLLKEGKKRLLTGLDSVFPIIPFGFPIQRALKINKNNKVVMFYPKFQESRSQDLEQGYQDAGQFYWFSIEALKREKKLWMKSSGAIILSEMDAQDIDTESDWKIAELKYKMKNND